MTEREIQLEKYFKSVYPDMSDLARDDHKWLGLVFGDKSSGSSPTLRAKSSRKLWVRGQDMISEYSVGASGGVMCAMDAFETFGWQFLAYKCYEGYKGITVNYDPCLALRDERIARGLAVEQVCDIRRDRFPHLRGVTSVEISDAEDNETKTKMWIIISLCEVYDLDWKGIGFVPMEMLRLSE